MIGRRKEKAMRVTQSRATTTRRKRVTRQRRRRRKKKKRRRRRRRRRCRCRRRGSCSLLSTSTSCLLPRSLALSPQSPRLNRYNLQIRLFFLHEGKRRGRALARLSSLARSTPTPPFQNPLFLFLSLARPSIELSRGALPYVSLSLARI